MITNVFTPTNTATVNNDNNDVDNTQVTGTNINNVMAGRRRKRNAADDEELMAFLESCLEG